MITRSEWRLGIWVAIGWSLANVFVLLMWASIRLRYGQPVNIAGTAVLLLMYVFEGVGGGVLAVYTARHAARVPIARMTILAIAIFFLSDASAEGVRALVRAIWAKPGYRAPLQLGMHAAVAMTHFFILGVCAVASALVLSWSERRRVVEEEAAAASARLNEIKLSTARSEIQPRLVSQTLAQIERLVGTDIDRSEALLLDLSDFLRLALLRTRGAEWSSALDAEYVRLREEVMEA